MTVAGVVAAAILVGCGGPKAGADAGDSGVAGRVLLGPQCAVEQQGDPCPELPAAGATVTVSEQLPGDSYAAGTVVASTTTDAHGRFRAAVPPGDYVVTADAGMSCELMDAHVRADRYTRVAVPCDTGIR